MTHSPSMLYQVEVKRVSPVLRDKRLKRLVSSVGRRAAADEAEPACNSVYMRVHRHCGHIKGEQQDTARCLEPHTVNRREIVTRRRHSPFSKEREVEASVLGQQMGQHLAYPRRLDSGQPGVRDGLLNLFYGSVCNRLQRPKPVQKGTEGPC